jgi:hypothetical protein
MTRPDILTCIHEPFGDAFYYGPERLSKRYEGDPQAREASGFANSTFKTIFERFDEEAKEVRFYSPLLLVFIDSSWVRRERLRFWSSKMQVH